MITRQKMKGKMNPDGTGNNHPTTDDGTVTNPQTRIKPDAKARTVLSEPDGTTTLTVTNVNLEQERLLAELNAEEENIKKRRELILAEQTTTSSRPGPIPTSRLSSPASADVSLEAVAKIVAILRPETPKPLPRFDGNALHWPEFLREFRSSTVERNLTKTENIIRLKKALHGPARSHVQGQLDEACFVDDIIDRLQHRFGGDDVLETAALAKAQKLSCLDRYNTTLSEFTLDAIRIHACVQMSGSSPLEKHILMILRGKLTPVLISAWLTYQRDLKRIGNLDDFLDWLKRTRSEHEDSQQHESGEERPRQRHRHDRYLDPRSKPFDRPTGSSYRAQHRYQNRAIEQRPHNQQEYRY